MDKQAKLDKIAKDIALCKKCKENKSGKAVPGEGNPNADIVFLGEAPGKNEALTGRPFIGRSGKLLRKLITEIGLKESEVFITSPVKYLPDYGTPKTKDIEHGKTHLQKQLDVIQPKLIVLLGRVAKEAMLGKKLLKEVAHKHIVVENNNTYFLTYHPAAAIRFQKFRGVLEKDFKELKRFIKE